MTTITVAGVQDHRWMTRMWLLVIAAIAVAGLTVGLVLSFTGGSTTAPAGTSPASSSVVTGQSGAGERPQLCPGSLKDRSC